MIVKWLLSSIQLIGFTFTCWDMYVISFYLNYCSMYVCSFFTRNDYYVWLWNNLYLIFSSLVQSLLAWICMLFLFIWTIVAGMLVAVLQAVISLYDSWMIIILYLVHWLIFTSFDLYMVSFHLNSCSQYVCGCFTRSDFIVWLWNDYHQIFSSLISLLLAEICILFSFFWIIVACMFVAILQDTINMYDCEILFILHLVHWFNLYLLRSLCYFFPFDLF